MYLISKITKIYEWWSCNEIYTSTKFRERINQEILNIQIDIVCDTQMNDHMHDRLICSNVSFITHVSLHIGYIETVHINNQTILQFVNLWSKKVPVNINYTSIFDPIDGYLYEIISPDYVKYITTRDIKYSKKRTRKRSQGGDCHRPLKK